VVPLTKLPNSFRKRDNLRLEERFLPGKMCRMSLLKVSLLLYSLLTLLAANFLSRCRPIGKTYQRNRLPCMVPAFHWSSISAKRYQPRRLGPTERPCVAAAADRARTATSVAVSKPSSNKMPIEYICQLRERIRKSDLENACNDPALGYRNVQILLSMASPTTQIRRAVTEARIRSSAYGIGS
jgi:hypothetical protein